MTSEVMERVTSEAQGLRMTTTTAGPTPPRGAPRRRSTVPSAGAARDASIARA
jgi:hypothetical protein